MQYTRHLAEGYEKEKLTDKSFALMPMPPIKYQEPGSCFHKGSTDGSKYQGMWNEKILAALKKKHPKNRFGVVDTATMTKIGINYFSLQTSAEEAAREFGLHQIELSKNNPLKVELAQKRNPVAEAECQKLKGEQFDYLIVPIYPEMHGEVQTTYHGAAGGMPGGASTQTTYYSDLQFVVFSAETGEAVYASGVLASSSGMCFIPPQVSTISGSGDGLATRISDLVAKVLNIRASSDARLVTAAH